MDAMDIDDWELLPVPNDTGHCTLFEFGLESEKDLLFSKQTNFFGPVAVVDNRYFILPSAPPPSDAPRDVESPTPAAEEEDEDGARDQEGDPVVEFKDIGVVQSPPQAMSGKLKDGELDDDDMSVWYPSFSPRDKKIAPLVGHEPMSFDAEEKEREEEEDDKRRRKRRPCWEGFGLKVGALCSVGAAAAAAVTICIFVLGGGHQQLNQDKYSQRLQFQIYTDDKGIKQAVQQASRLNCTLAVGRGVPTRRAHISFGGHYTGF